MRSWNGLASHRLALKAAVAVTAFVAAGTAQAQTVFHWPAPEAQSVGAAKRYYLPMGTPLMLKTRTQVSTKDNKVGDRVYLEVAESVSYRGQIVIPIGSPVVGEVASFQRNGHVGKKGKIEIRLLYAETPSGPVRLTGSSRDEGTSGTAASVATMVLLSPLGGFLIHGTSAKIEAGTAVEAYLAEPLRFTWYPQSESKIALLPATPDSYEAAKPGFSALGVAD